MRDSISPPRGCPIRMRLCGLWDAKRPGAPCLASETWVASDDSRAPRPASAVALALALPLPLPFFLSFPPGICFCLYPCLCFLAIIPNAARNILLPPPMPSSRPERSAVERPLYWPLPLLFIPTGNVLLPSPRPRETPPVTAGRRLLATPRLVARCFSFGPPRVSERLNGNPSSLPQAGVKPKAQRLNCLLSRPRPIHAGHAKPLAVRAGRPILNLTSCPPNPKPHSPPSPTS